MSGRVGVYPGTFNPPTVAHLAIARAARDQRNLTTVVLTMSRAPIGKEHVDRPRLEDRLAVLRVEAGRAGWLDVAVTDDQLLVDIALGYDVLIMGADKWAQVNDPRYYGGDPDCRDAAVSALPELAIAPRPPFPVPREHALVMDGDLAAVSSTAARAGVATLMSPAAAEFDARTGAWSDAARYERWLRDQAITA